MLVLEGVRDLNTSTSTKQLWPRTDAKVNVSSVLVDPPVQLSNRVLDAIIEAIGDLTEDRDAHVGPPFYSSLFQALENISFLLVLVAVRSKLLSVQDASDVDLGRYWVRDIVLGARPLNGHVL